MSRIRTVKPEYWEHPKVAKVSRDARLFFLGLLTECDDEGKLRYNAKRLAGVLFGSDDDVDGTVIDAWAAELERADLAYRYTVGDASLLVVPGFTEHQRVSHPSPSRLPNPSEPFHPLTVVLPKSSGEAPDSLCPEGEGEWKGMEGEAPASPVAAPALGPHDKRKTAVPCPDGWGVTDGMQTWVEDRCPLIDWRLQTDRFLAWAESKGAKYQDWDRAWDNWMLKAQDDQTARTPRAAVR